MDTRLAGAAPEREAWAWPTGETDETDEYGDLSLEDIRPYPTRWSRPGAQLAAKVALWGAVAFGCVSGMLALGRQPQAAPVQQAASASATGLPAQVAGTAERAVAAWLSADGEGRDDLLADLFVEQVTVPTARETALEIGDATTIAGREAADGYWWVTVAVEVTETPEVQVGEDGQPMSDAPEPITTTWYVEVGVVGDVGSGLSALSTPAVLPIAPATQSGWRLPSGFTVDRGSDQFETIEGFLRALLVGDGDPIRYMTPGASVDLPAVPVFVELDIVDVVVAQEDEQGGVRVRVDADAETAGGVTRRVAYALTLAQREGRWEVVALPGNPAVMRDGDADSGGDANSGGGAGAAEGPQASTTTTSAPTSTTERPAADGETEESVPPPSQD